MSYEKRIREARPGMSKSFVRLADHLLDSYIQAALMTATEIAHQVDVDAATVVRFAQKLGYRGFPELQREIRDKVKRDLLIRPEEAADPESVPGVVDATFIKLGGAIEQARKLLDSDAVDELVTMIGNARRIIIIPESLGQAAAYNLFSLLEQGGFIVTVMQSGVTDLARTVSTAGSEDLLLAIDVAGAAPYISRALQEAADRKVPTAAIVGAASLDSASSAKVVLAAQNQPAIGIGIVVVDAIVYALAEALRWRFGERFLGTEEAIEKMYNRIRIGEK